MCSKQASGRIVGLAYSYSDNYMFWSDISLVNRGIYRATVDSSGNLGQANKTVSDGQCAPAVIARSHSVTAVIISCLLRKIRQYGTTLRKYQIALCTTRA